jgi:aspartyl-tRNA(Asn)/glutamyl-tRNA(Gln) amidotransferase subunit C
MELLFMSLTKDDVKKIAHLARLNMPEEDLAHFTPQLSGILDFVEQMNQSDTNHIEPLAHPLDLSQRLRLDVVTEVDQREANQAIAPQVEAGLYLVPKVIDAE